MNLEEFSPSGVNSNPTTLATSTHCVGGLVGPRTAPNMAPKKMLSLPGVEHQTSSGLLID
jgi:hypothetical protein